MTKKELLMNLMAYLKERGIDYRNVTAQDVADWHPHVGMGNTKVQAACIDMIAGITCPPTVPCYKECYAKHGRMAFSYNKALHYLNLLIWKADPERYEREIREILQTQKYARFNADGDMPDEEYVAMVWRIAESCPNCEIWFMTKWFGRINAQVAKCGIPRNLHPMLSAWGNWQPENPHNLPVFHVRLKSGEGAECIPEDAYHCPSDCNICKMAGRGCMNGDTVVIDQHR